MNKYIISLILILCYTTPSKQVAVTVTGITHHYLIVVRFNYLLSHTTLKSYPSQEEEREELLKLSNQPTQFQNSYIDK